jgi:hypothetical protein
MYSVYFYFKIDQTAGCSLTLGILGILDILGTFLLPITNN